MSDSTFEISIPADNDGFVLLQCPYCGEFFKITPDGFKDRAIWNCSARLAVSLEKTLSQRMFWNWPWR
jgi:hypothetical protein